MAHPVLVPLLNPNEPEATVVELRVGEGDEIGVGDVICTLETTKSTEDLEAVASGFVVGLSARVGSTVRAGELLCHIAPTPDWLPPPAPAGPGSAEDAPRPDGVPDGVRITGPALALARSAGLDLALLPAGPLVTAATVAALLDAPGLASASAPDPRPPARAGAVVVYGGGGHGRTLIELLVALGGFDLVGVVDDGLAPGGVVLGIPVLGGDAILDRLRAEGVGLVANGVGGIGDPGSRVAVFARIAAAGMKAPTLLHPTAVVEPSAELESGAQVLARAYVGSGARVGFGAIVNTAAVVSHDCVVGDHANVSPGALIAGAARIGAGALIGMGVTVNLGVTVGARARVGNGATVKADVPDGAVVRAGSVWPRA